MMADWRLAGSWGRAIKLDPEGAFTLGEGLFLTQRLQFGPRGISDRLRCPGRCPSPTIGLRMCGGLGGPPITMAPPVEAQTGEGPPPNRKARCSPMSDAMFEICPCRRAM